jgi:hypothetical protein
MAARPLHRARQFFGALRPRVDPVLRDEAFALLNDGERRLFESMTPRDQQHCLDVFRHLREAGQDDRDLLVAALLHDAGKGRIALWHRVAYVLLDTAAPGLLRGSVRPGDSLAWREALYRCVHHEALGAEQARQAGSSAHVVALIRGGDIDPNDPRLAALHAADDTA